MDSPRVIEPCRTHWSVDYGNDVWPVLEHMCAEPDSAHTGVHRCRCGDTIRPITMDAEQAHGEL